MTVSLVEFTGLGELVYAKGVEGYGSYLGHLGSGGSPLTKTRDTGREIGQGGGRHHL